MAIVPQQRRNQAQNGESKCKLKIISNEITPLPFFQRTAKNSKNKARLLHPVIELDDSGLRITNRF